MEFKKAIQNTYKVLFCGKLTNLSFGIFSYSNDLDKNSKTVKLSLLKVKSIDEHIDFFDHFEAYFFNFSVNASRFSFSFYGSSSTKEFKNKSVE